jgi:hypothetical protein
VAEQQLRFAGQVSRVERVFHQREHINVVRLGFVGNERAEHDESGDMPGSKRDPADAFEAIEYELPLRRPGPEPLSDVGERGRMDRQASRRPR